MEKFQVIQPLVRLAPFVKQYWFISAAGIVRSHQRVIPSGYTGLVFNREGRILSAVDESVLPASYIFGQTLAPVDLSFSGNIDLIMIIFQPAGASAFFDMPINELYGINVPVDILGDSDLIELSNLLTGCRDNILCVRRIEDYLLRKLSQINNRFLERFNSVICAVNRGESDIDKLADSIYLGYKQFKRLFKAHVGLNPKEYLRIVRGASTLRRIQTDPSKSLSELAFEYGYYDKSHLIKEFKNLYHYIPSVYLANSEPYSEYKAVFQSLFIDVKH